MKESKKGTRLPIDPVKLKSCLERVGTIEEVAKQLGYEYSTIKTAMTSKSISKPMMTAFDIILGIKYEYYMPVKYTEKQKQELNEKDKKTVNDVSIEEYLFMILQELKGINVWGGRG